MPVNHQQDAYDKADETDYSLYVWLHKLLHMVGTARCAVTARIPGGIFG